MISDSLFEMSESLEDGEHSLSEILKEGSDSIKSYRSNNSYSSDYNQEDRQKIEAFEKELNNVLSSGKEDDMRAIINKGHELAQDFSSLPA